MTDLEIARSFTYKPIAEVAKNSGFNENEIELYGKYKAKIDVNEFYPSAKLILVTAINPSSLGEGKTTVSIGLADAINLTGNKCMLALREPSLGPVFGIKGGAAGGGYSQVVPMEDINLHFTGDIHAITSANNLLSALIDNHIFQGNDLRIDTERILWRRCMDMNDRNLRCVRTGLGGEKNGIPADNGFDITAASEIMAILCLSRDLADLKCRLGNIHIAYDVDGKPVFAKQLKAEGSMALLLKDAIKPNLVQTLAGNPAIIHGGPFANIAHGCNSIRATLTAMSRSEYVVTEAGFGADLGAEKFLDVKCRAGVIKPSAVVIVATVRALMLGGGADKTNIGHDIETLKRGVCNLGKHVENITKVFGLPCVVAINRFTCDTDEEIGVIESYCNTLGVDAVPCEVWAKGGEGGLELAKKTLELCEKPSELTYAYDLSDSIENKLNSIVTKIYGGDGIELSDKAKKEIAKIKEMGMDKLPVIIAKTQYSLSDNPTLLGRPSGFTVKISDIKLRSGAGFIVAIAGNMLLMPGLSKTPAAMNMDIDNDGNITGLF
ncbi:MAG: formate--tetrahydrofolate ligase [Clostridia bacterium]|nr:formate--tetrahydrofolate ligase [Clostridia bacterium]